MKSYSMKGQKELSDLGIVVSLGVLERNPNVFEVTNVENDRYYQEKDIDLLVKMKIKESKGWVGIEVKCDSYKSGNLYFETISNINKNTLGCLLYSEAHFLFYYFEKLEELYILPMQSFRQWFLRNKSSFNKKNTYTKDTKGKILYKSEGYTIPLDVIKKDFKRVKVIKIKNDISITK